MDMSTPTESKKPAHERPRAVFSTQDFELLRAAVSEHIRHCKDPDEADKYAHLLHRLRRVS
jgi:hypothetical protein